LFAAIVPAEHWGVALLALAVAVPAVADSGGGLAIPAEPLGDAVLALGQAVDVSVGLGAGVSARLPARAVRGRLDARSALQRLVRGLPVSVVEIDPRTFRLDRIAPRAPKRESRHPPGLVPDAGDIIVTASKREARLDTIPATVLRTRPSAETGAAGLQGSGALVDALASVGSTALGPGRNKLFLRGVADSSFNGLSQSTVGQYFGEARVTYNAPDPDLLLVDTSSVEVLEGPQGALYGAAALGGVIRIQPNPVRLDATEGELSLGLSGTAHGAGGSDGSAMLNLPLLPGRLGVRLVAYRLVQGGYIDDAERGLADVNRTVTRGGRLTLAGALGGGWTVEGGGIVQFIDAADGQYAERGQPPLTRRNTIAQPFDNDYRLGDVVVRGPLGGAALVSVTSAVRHDVDSTFDFTADGQAPREFGESDGITLLSQETRLQRTQRDGAGWLLGLSLLREDERLIRTLGSPPAPSRITGVRNIASEAALYGEWTVQFAPRLWATVGARAGADRLSGYELDAADRAERPGSHRHEARLVPLAALAWRPHDGLLVFGRYAGGYRPGGLSVAGEGDPGDGTAAPQRFRGDTIGTAEAGVRTDAAGRMLTLMATLSVARWRHIQADLVNLAGFPFTANVGAGRILAAEMGATARLPASFRIEAALTLQKGHLTHPEIAVADADDRDLPNVAGVGARLAVAWHHPLRSALALDADASARFVGRSHLGVGDVLDVPQGGYLDSSLGLRLGDAHLGVTLGVSNVADTRGDRFAFGDPFDVADRRQVTPLHPRTVRVGLEARF
jgi:outer membrane receptor protein involved in Fe transport